MKPEADQLLEPRKLLTKALQRTATATPTNPGLRQKDTPSVSAESGVSHTAVRIDTVHNEQLRVWAADKAEQEAERRA